MQAKCFSCCLRSGARSWMHRAEDTCEERSLGHPGERAAAAAGPGARPDGGWRDVPPPAN